jgi:hypothetical protein
MGSCSYSFQPTTRLETDLDVEGREVLQRVGGDSANKGLRERRRRALQDADESPAL